MTIDSIAKEFECVGLAVFDVCCDDKYDNAAIISDSDTLDDFIEIMDILSRIESRKIRAIKRENESIL